MNTQISSSDVASFRDFAQLRLNPHADFKTVALTPQQQFEWDVTRTRFLSSCPAFAHVLYTMMAWADGSLASFTEDERIPIAATDGQRLILRPSTFFKMTADERVFVVAHEVLHAVMDHCALGYRFRQTGFVNYADGERVPYQHQIMNMALDFVINDILVESQIGKMPSVGYHDRKIAVHTDEALEVYRKLMQNVQVPTSEGSGGKGFDELLDPGQLASRDGGDTNGQTPEQSMQGRSEAEWKTALAAGVAAQKAMGQGTLPGALQRLVDEIINPTVPWQEHIKALFARKVGAGGYDWRRPERQLISRPFMAGVSRMSSAEQAVFAPGRSGKGVGCVVVAIDTSGSIGDKELSTFFGEMSGIIDDCRPERIVVMFCDAKVQRVDEVEDAGDLVTLRGKGAPGGGGTSFRPVFHEIAQMGLEPDALVYFTDMYGDFPDRAPAYPTIWAAISDVKAPFGDLVKVKL